VVLPEPGGDRRLLASLGRKKPIEFIRGLREVTGCGLGDAKAVLQHLTHQRGCCHRCSAEVAFDDLVDCEACGSLNIQLEGQAPSLPCPACGFMVFGTSYGSYDICPLCDWEDDGVQLANPTSAGGANKGSLVEAQSLALKKFPSARNEVRHFKRAPDWRPLTDIEVTAFEAMRTHSHWPSVAVVDQSEAYWMRGRGA
jgi:hypothetical protein